MANTVDRRVKVNFPTLDERQENKIVSELMDYLVWYKKNQEEVDKFIQNNGKKVNDVSIVEFWIQYIGKSEEIEKMLSNMSVVADCFEYVKKYKNIILTLKKEPEKWVCTKQHYRTEEQARKLKQLLSELQNHPEVKKIIEFLKRYRFDADHIPAKYAEGIIRKCLALKRGA